MRDHTDGKFIGIIPNYPGQFEIIPGKIQIILDRFRIDLDRI